MANEASQVRNIGIVGQGGVGKTSLADAILFTAGVTTRLGSVDDGSSAFDFEPEEMRRKLSLTTAFHHAPWKKHELTLIDTPGYVNFLTDGLNCMRAATAALFVIEPQAGGIKVEAERVWSRAEQLQLPVVAFVTKMDRENADFDAALKDLTAILQAKPVPVQLPIGSAESFKGVIDLVAMKALIAQPNGQVKEEAVPADLLDAAKAARERLVEAAAETDDALVEQYLESGELTDEQLMQALRAAVQGARFVPVLCGAGSKALGTAPLLDFLVDYTPSPLLCGAAAGEDPRSNEPSERQRSPSAPFSAVVVKNIVDPFSGKLSVFQVVSGEVTSDSNVLNVNKDAKERLGHLLRLEGKKQAQVDKLTTGEIGAVAKLKDTEAGDTLADEKAPIRYSGTVPVSAAISFAIEPKAKGDEDKAVQGLHKLIEEDPTLKMQRDAQTKEIILSGVGQLHIEVAVEKLKRKFGVDVELKAPKVPYKETIKGTAKAQGRLKKQTGGRGQFGDTWIEVAPLPRGTGFEFVDAIVGGVIPRQFIPAVEKGVREALQEGLLAGYETIDVRVKLYDGSHHSVDSSEMAFKIAASMGFKAAVQQAKPILLEPIMAMEIAVPDDCIGDVIGDLNSRRGKVLGVDPKVGSQVIRALVPMAEVLRYSPDLRSMTSGRGAFTMEFDHYEELPAHLADKVIKEAEERKAAAHQH
ncbi:MAG: elongation factor G [Candidatus Binatia bacterium]